MPHCRNPVEAGTVPILTRGLRLQPRADASNDDHLDDGTARARRGARRVSGTDEVIAVREQALYPSATTLQVGEAPGTPRPGASPCGGHGYPETEHWNWGRHEVIETQGAGRAAARVSADDAAGRP